MQLVLILSAFLGAVLATEYRNHEYYSNLRHLQKSEKMIAGPQEHDHEYYSNLRHLNHDEDNVVKNHEYYSNLHHLKHSEKHQRLHEYYANLRHLNHDREEDIRHLKSHEYYSNLRHLNHENEKQTQTHKGHEYYSNLHHLQHDNDEDNEVEPRLRRPFHHNRMHHLSHDRYYNRDHGYYSNLHHLRHEDRDNEYFHHMHRMHRHHMHHFHGCADDYHRHGHRSHALFWMLMPFRMLCSVDDCVDQSTKNSIITGWTQTGQDIWQQCNPEGTCAQKDLRKILKCMGKTLLLNKTDITVQEYRETWRSWSILGLKDCCENQITMKMMRCTKPQFHHFHRHHNGGSCHKRPQPPQEPQVPQVEEHEPEEERPQEGTMEHEPKYNEEPTVESVPTEDEEEPIEEEESHFHHNARHHFERLNSVYHN